MIDPVLFNVGPLEIRYYGILIASAFLIGYFLLIKLNDKIKRELIEDYVAYMILGIVVGARLFHVLFYSWDYFSQNLISILYVWKGGLSSHGGMIGGALVTYWFCKKHKINIYDISDIAVIPIALGASFVRIGNFINGELIGKVMNNGLRYPVQLYQSVSNLSLFLFLLSIRKKFKKGVLTWLFFLIYSLLRFFTEFFKDLPWKYSETLNLAQTVSLFLIIISAIMLYKIISSEKE